MSLPEPSVRKYKISIENFIDGEHVSHSVILVKFQVDNFNESSTGGVFIRDQRCQNWPCDYYQRCGSLLKFRCLLRLCAGVNTLTVNCCSVETSLSLFFERPKQERLVELQYIVCDGHDGRFQSTAEDSYVDDACQRINLAVELIQCLISEALHEAGLARKTFRFEECRPVHSNLTLAGALQADEGQLWNHLAKELIAGQVASRETKHIGFLACTHFEGLNVPDYTEEDIKRRTRANIALGIGDVALVGTGCLYTWPSNLLDVVPHFHNITPVDISRQMDDSNSRRTYGGCFATTLGALCHEIGHIFDLGHTQTGIMGTDFDLVNRFFLVDSPPNEILPPRIVGQCKASSGGKDPRLTRVRTENQYLKQFRKRQADLVFFERPSLVTLFHHRWFNTALEVKPPEWRFENDTISSRNPLRLVEIRDGITAVTIEYFEFSGEKQVFRLPAKFKRGDCNIIVMDVKGNVSRF